MAVILPNYNPYAGLAEGLQNFLGGREQSYQKKAMAEDVNALVQYLQNGGPAPVPKTQYGTQLLGQITTQQAQPKTQVVELSDENGPYRAVVDSRTGQIVQRIGQSPTSVGDIRAQQIQQLQQKEALGSITVPEREMLNRMLVGGNQTTVNVPIDLAAEKESAEQKSQRLIQMKEMADQWNTRNPSSPQKMVVKKGDFEFEDKPTASATEREKLDQVYNILGNIDVINDLYNPDYVGLVRGSQTLADIKEKTGVGVDKNEVEFRRLTKNISDQLLRARSGAQINEQEYQRLSKIVPTADLSPEAFESRLNGFKEELNRVIEQKQSTYKQAEFKQQESAGPPEGAKQINGKWIIEKNGKYYEWTP